MTPKFEDLTLIADECPLSMSDYLQLWKSCSERRENQIVIEKSHPNLDQLKISLGELRDNNMLWFVERDDGTLRVNLPMRFARLPDND